MARKVNLTKTFWSGKKPDLFEITWQSGHVETIEAHQVTWPNNSARIFGGQDKPPLIHFHAEIRGRWTLVLAAHEADLRTVRRITDGEQVLGGWSQ